MNDYEDRMRARSLPTSSDAWVADALESIAFNPNPLSEARRRIVLDAARRLRVRVESVGPVDAEIIEMGA